MNARLTADSGSVQPGAPKFPGKFNACNVMEAIMTRTKKRSLLPAIAFIYLALIGGFLLTASGALAI
jgi:hypothetical protein